MQQQSQRWIPALLAAVLFSAVVVVPFLPASHRRAAPFCLTVRMASSAAGHVQVYYDSGRGFREEDSIAVPLAQSATALPYRLPLPTGAFRALRFDPIDRDGTVTIAGPRLIDPAGRPVRDFPLSAFQPIHQIQSLREAGGQLEVVVTPRGDDPQLLLAFDPPLILATHWEDAARDWLERSAGVLAGLLVLGGLARVWRRRLSPAAVAGWLTRRPGRAIALVAAAAVVASAYPVVFLGKSYVSPNLGASLLYDGFPTLPGYGEPGTVDLKNSDIGAAFWQCVPYSAVEHRALLRDHEWPVWNRDNSCGTPLLGQGQSMFGDPLHLLVIAADGAAWAWDLKYLAAKWLFAAGLGLLVLALTRHLPAALIVSLAAPFIGFFIYRVNHPAFFSLCYAPWPLYCWVRIAQAGSWRATAGASLGLVAANLALLASGTVKEAGVLLVTMNFSGACVLLATPVPWRLRLRRLAWLAWVGGLFVLLTAPLWFSFLETLRQASTDYDTPSAYQVQPGLMLAAFDEAFYRPLAADEQVFNPSVNFLILGGLLYFAATLRRQFSDRAAMALAASMLVPLGFAFGAVPPAWIVQIPFLGNVIHIDNCFSCALVVLWSALAGVGFATAARQLGTPEGRADLAIAGLLLGGLVFAYLGFGHAVHRPAFAESRFSMLGNGQALPIRPFVLIYLATLLAALAALGLIARRALQCRAVSRAQLLGLALGAAVLLWRHGQQAAGVGFEDYAVHPTVRTDFAAPSAAVQFVQAAQRSEPSRGIGLYSNFCPGWTGVYALEGISGPDALMNPRYLELVGLSPLEHMTEWWPYLRADNLAAARPFLDFLNVRYYFTPPGDRAAPAAGLRLERRADLDVYESPTAWPRAFFSDRLVVYRAPGELLHRILEGDGRPFAAVAAAELAARPELAPLAGAGAGTPAVPATDYRLTADTTSFTIRAPRRGIVALGETFWPGYVHAAVDGRRAAAIRLNHAFTGIVIDSPGEHHIEVEYRPRRFTLLLGLAAAGGALLLGTSWALARRPAPAALN